MPPSKVVCLPQRKGPLLPPRERNKVTDPPQSANIIQQRDTLNQIEICRLLLNKLPFLHESCFQTIRPELIVVVVVVVLNPFMINFRSIISVQREPDSWTLLATYWTKNKKHRKDFEAFSFPLGMFTAVCNLKKSHTFTRVLSSQPVTEPEQH